MFFGHVLRIPFSRASALRVHACLHDVVAGRVPATLYSDARGVELGSHHGRKGNRMGEGVPDADAWRDGEHEARTRP